MNEKNSAENFTAAKIYDRKFTEVNFPTAMFQLLSLAENFEKCDFFLIILEGNYPHRARILRLKC